MFCTATSTSSPLADEQSVTSLPLSLICHVVCARSEVIAIDPVGGREEDGLIVGLMRLILPSAKAGQSGRCAACRALAYLSCSNTHNRRQMMFLTAHKALLCVLACDQSKLANAKVCRVIEDNQPAFILSTLEMRAQRAAWDQFGCTERLAEGSNRTSDGFLLLDEENEMSPTSASAAPGSSPHRFKGRARGPRVKIYPSVATRESPDFIGKSRRLLEFEDLLAARTLQELHKGQTSA
eukprot:SAG31_NODE_2334_length_5929_cov_1.453516_5_plen_238_part_00